MVSLMFVFFSFFQVFIDEISDKLFFAIFFLIVYTHGT